MPQSVRSTKNSGRSSDQRKLRMKKKRTVKFPYGLPTAEAFELRVIRPKNLEDCWGWKGSITGKGYAQCPPYGPVYRWCLEQKLGRKLLPGEHCRHMCGNPLCTNPNHLEVGSNKDNCRDKPQQHNGKYGSSSFYKLTQKDADEICRLCESIPQKEIAAMYSISPGMVSRILTKRAWNVH